MTSQEMNRVQFCARISTSLDLAPDGQKITFKNTSDRIMSLKLTSSDKRVKFQNLPTAMIVVPPGQSYDIIGCWREYTHNCFERKKHRGKLHISVRTAEIGDEEVENLSGFWNKATVFDRAIFCIEERTTYQEMDRVQFSARILTSFDLDPDGKRIIFNNTSDRSISLKLKSSDKRVVFHNLSTAMIIVPPAQSYDIIGCLRDYTPNCFEKKKHRGKLHISVLIAEISEQEMQGLSAFWKNQTLYDKATFSIEGA